MCVCPAFILPLSFSQAGESVLSALSGCKILRELSKMENETESKLAMKELAQRFENLAHGERITGMMKNTTKYIMHFLGH